MVECKQDEVSLLDLWHIIVAQKKIVIITWLACVLLGMVYVFLATPIYKAEVFMLPPSQKDIQALNIDLPNQGDRRDRRDRGIHYNVVDVYDVFVQTLKSRANRRTFYQKHHVAQKLGFREGDDGEVFFEDKFNKKLIVSRDVKKKNSGNFTSASLSVPYAELSAEWLNKFIADTSLLVAKQLASEVNAKVQGSKLALKDAINGKLQLAAKRREDRIIALQEALLISQSLKGSDVNLKATLRTKSLSINTDDIPLYMLSPSALAAEIKMLKERKDDAPFIEGLRDLEEELATLQQIKVTPEDVRVMFLDQKAFVPIEPEKPKKGLIMILAMLLGLMLGVVVGFIRNAVMGLRGKS